MTPSSAEHVVIASLFATGAIETIGAVSAGHAPSLRVGLGLTVAGVLLTAMAGTAPQVAAGFAVLVLVSTLFSSGLSALDELRKALA